jgi:thiol-disulfide isomerase/thioredoxin
VLSLATAAVLWGSLCARAEQGAAEDQGANRIEGARWLPLPQDQPTPALRLPDLQGLVWDLAQEQGLPVLVNFWATWCEPCRAEMKSFEVLQSHFAARRLKVVAVNYKEARDVVLRFRNANAVSLALVRDSYGDATRAWGVTIFPTTFVINSSGRAIVRIEGEVDWGQAANQKRLHTFL